MKNHSKSVVFRNRREKKKVEVKGGKSHLFWMALTCIGGHGFRTAVGTISMTVEAELINVGEIVIAVWEIGERQILRSL
ncbi:MAG: hypothetical protein ACUVUU_00385 [bacterium]